MKKVLLLFFFLGLIHNSVYANEKIIFSKDGLITEKNIYNHESFILKPSNINPLFQKCHLNDTTKIIIHKIDKGLILYRGHIDDITQKCNIIKTNIYKKDKKNNLISYGDDFFYFKTF